MAGLFAPDPVGQPGIIALMVGLVLFVGAVIAMRRTRENESGAARSRGSIGGIALQGLAIASVGIGPPLVSLAPGSAKALSEGAAVLLLMVAATALFVWAARTMGRNWSIVARTRTDHQLVEGGPFRYVRHPIYTAIFLIMLATAIAIGHGRQMIVGIALYALGTAIRVGVEERMLRGMFGTDYEAYAARVNRFVPGVF